MRGKPEYSGNYCGCCGRMCGCDEWCRDCVPHLTAGRIPPWDRTYVARYGQECPFAPKEGAPEAAWDAIQPESRPGFPPTAGLDGEGLTALRKAGKE